MSGTMVERRDHVLITFFLVARVQAFNLFAQMAVHERSLF